MGQGLNTHPSCRRSASRASPSKVWSGCGIPASQAAAQGPVPRLAEGPVAAAAGVLVHEQWLAAAGLTQSQHRHVEQSVTASNSAVCLAPRYRLSLR